MKNTIAILAIILGVLLLNDACNKRKVNNRFATIEKPQFENVTKVLNKYVREKKVTGGVALVYHNHEIVLHKSFGTSNIEQNIPFTNDNIFRIASMTKPITSVAAMMLYEEGKFKLDDPVSKFIPEFSNLQVLDRINRQDSSFVAHPASQVMTIEQLFTFSSGLYYGFDNDSLSLLFAKAGISEGFEERDILLADNIKKLATLPLLHEPGERYHYGLEMDVLGRLIEIWSGMPLDKFFANRIFKPLGMQDTYFYLPKEKEQRLVPVYMNTPDGIAPTDYPLTEYPIRGAKKYFSGGADLSSTAYDYFLFCKMMLQKGELHGVRLLKPETVALMSSTHLETGDQDMGLGFGLLSAKTHTDLARSVGSISWGGFFSTTFWIDPAEQVIGILMLQMYPFEYWNIQKEFENSIYDAIHNNR